MTRARWLVIGTVVVGVMVVLYLIFFCPSECH